MYYQRYIPHLPAGGEVVIFDRSWYNRAGVEPVMGFCTWEESARFLELVPVVEQAIIDSGVILIKYWLEVSQEEQTRRLTARIDDGRKTWKLSQMDIDSYGRWYDYSRARDNMFAATDTETAPWYVANSDDKRRARLNIISHILDLVPYEREEQAISGPAASPEDGRLQGAACASTRSAAAVLIRSPRKHLDRLRALGQVEQVDYRARCETGAGAPSRRSPPAQACAGLAGGRERSSACPAPLPHRRYPRMRCRNGTGSRTVRN